MERHPQHPDWLQVKFTPGALEDWGACWPEAPPGDEVVLWIKLGPCSVCGKEQPEGEFGGMDPEGVTSEGLIYGPQICQACMEAGE